MTSVCRVGFHASIPYLGGFAWKRERRAVAIERVFPGVVEIRTAPTTAQLNRQTTSDASGLQAFRGDPSRPRSRASQHAIMSRRRSPALRTGVLRGRVPPSPQPKGRGARVLPDELPLVPPEHHVGAASAEAIRRGLAGGFRSAVVFANSPR